MFRVASLGMYDVPSLAAANDTLWRAIAAELRRAGMADVPMALDRDRLLEIVLRDPHLLLGHTCGYPLMTSLRGRVRVVATPCFDLPGCEGAWHRALIVVAAGSAARSLEDLRGGVAAVNTPDSNTGMNLLRAAIAPLARRGRFFRDVITTGAHLTSLAAVAAGRADVAAIDCVTHGLAASHLPDVLAGTRVLAPTAATPGLPLVTSIDASEWDAATLRAALAAVAADPNLAEVRRELALSGFTVLPQVRYRRVMALEAAAIRQGFAALG